MFNDMQIPVILGASSGWLVDGNSSIIERTLAANDTYVEFPIPSNSDYGYQLFLDSSTASTANTAKPKQNGDLDFTTTSGSVRINFASAITSAQAGTKARLRVYK